MGARERHTHTHKQTIPTGTKREIKGEMQNEICMPSKTNSETATIEIQWDAGGGSQRKIHTKIQTEWDTECQRHSEAARETHKWRHREIYMTEKKKQVPGQINTQGRVKHANKQQDITGQSLIHSEPFRPKQSEWHVTPQEWNTCLTRQKNSQMLTHKEITQTEADVTSMYTKIGTHINRERDTDIHSL